MKPKYKVGDRISAEIYGIITNEDDGIASYLIEGLPYAYTADYIDKHWKVTNGESGQWKKKEMAVKAPKYAVGQKIGKKTVTEKELFADRWFYTLEEKKEEVVSEKELEELEKNEEIEI